MGLKEFLVNAKAGLTELQTHPRIHVVIGNESCDLDSTVSAVTYAYFLHETESKPGTFILPVLNIPRQLYRLRLEIIYLLHKHNITQDDLTFVDELDLQTLTQSEDLDLSVTLVDHHACSKDQECLRDFVVEVLDHRPMSGVLPESWNAEIERVGSCCTLVARKMLASETFSLDSVLAELLLGTILMDTGNMSPIDNVGTPADLEVISQLKAYVSPDTADIIYEGIRNAKADLSSLTVLEMLYKDLKVLRGTHITVAMSSLTAKLEDVMSRPEFADDCAAFCSACAADVLIIMTLWKDGGGMSHRRIAVFSRNRIYREQITDVLLSSVSPNLELEPMTSCSDMDNISAFFQNNVQVFRKGVTPLIQKFLAGEESTPDENLNAVDNLQLYPDSPLESDLLSEVADVSEEEVRKHINLAKTFQSDQFRTSQDRYDLAAIGTDPVISASLSSDSEFSLSDRRKDGGLDGDDDDDTDDNSVENKALKDQSYGFNSGAKMSDDFFVNNKSGAGDGADVDAVVDLKSAVLGGDGEFVNDLVDFGFHSKDVEVSPSVEGKSDFTHLAGGHEQGFVNSLDIPFSVEPQDFDQTSFSDLDVKVLDSRDDTMGDLFSVSSDNVDVDFTTIDAKDENFGDAFQDHSPFNLFDPDNIDGAVDISSMPTSGQGSKIPSYPETPPNSCMEPSNAVFNKETQLPSFNSSEMVKRIHEKKAALAGYGGKQKMGMFDDEGPFESLLLGGENSSGGGGSLVSPAVPQNSYVDVSKGFDFESSGSELPKLMNSDIMERVNEKRSQFEWSVESLDGSTSGVDIGPASEEGEKSPFLTDAAQSTISGGAEPQVPYTPQNSYVEENFDSYARANLPSLNNAEIVAKIKAKQSAMFSSHGSSRVSRSSHGSDDSGGCHSPDVVDKSPRGTSLDSPQAPYTPQNSYRDNLGVLETRNHLPDLNEVAERLSTENPLKRQFGKRSGSNSGGGSRDEENINLNIHQHSLRHHGRNSSSQSDSQNTMSDVESLMSLSTEVGTPSDNIVASGLANQMRSEIAMLSRKDTDDSDVFSPKKPDDYFSETKEMAPPKVSSIDLSGDGATSNVARIVPNGIDAEESDGIVRSGSGGIKELFSPFDSEKVQSIEDHALFQVAESIVAQSVAAAVEFSQKEPQVGQARKESRLRWNDDVEVGNNDNENYVRRSPKIFVGDEEEDEEEDDNDESDIEDDTVGDISESFPENDLDKMGSENGSMENINSENVAEEMTRESFEGRGFDSDSNSLSAQEQSYSLVDQVEDDDSMAQQYADASTARQEEFTQSFGSDVLESSQQIKISDVPPVSQSITDLTLNELAYELANELIQSVLDDFPFREYLATIHAEAAANNIGPVAVEEGTDSKRNISSKGSPLDSTWIHDSTEVDMSANNDADFSAAGEDENNSSADDCIIKHSGIIIESKTSPDSHDPNSVSSSSERKRLKDTDPSLVILENEMLTTFPERKSPEFPELEEEEDIIESFPGRKFSKSEDYPSRRFSREDNSSRFEDSELEVTIGPEDIETGYLPNMDPLQGNLDILVTSFSKITDADREVVEGESFRRASGGDFASSDDEEEEKEDRGSDNEEESSQNVDDSESISVVGVEDVDIGVTHDDDFVEASRSIPEVREELVSEDVDFSRDLYSESAGGQTVEEPFADFSRDLDSEYAGGQIEDEPFADFSRDLDSESASGEVEDEPFADFSRDLDSKSPVGRTEEEPFVDFSRDFSSESAGGQTVELLADFSRDLDSESAGGRTLEEPFADFSRDLDSESAGGQIEDEPFADSSGDIESESADGQTAQKLFANFSRDFDSESAGGEVDDAPFADVSRDLDSKSPVGRTEEEPFVDFSRDFVSESAGVEVEDEPFADFSDDAPFADVSRDLDSKSPVGRTEEEPFVDFSRDFVSESAGGEVDEPFADFSRDLDSESPGGEVEDAPFADVSRDLDSKSPVGRTEEEPFVDFSRDFVSESAGGEVEDEPFADFSRDLDSESPGYEVEDAPFADVSRDLDSKSPVGRTEEEPFVDFSRDFVSESAGGEVEDEPFADFSRDLDSESASGEVEDVPFADFSRDLDSKSPVGRTEEEPFADFSRDLDSESVGGQIEDEPFADSSGDIESESADGQTAQKLFANFSRDLDSESALGEVEDAPFADVSRDLDSKSSVGRTEEEPFVDFSRDFVSESAGGEVEDEPFPDFSRDLDSKSPVGRTEEEPFVDFSRDLVSESAGGEVEDESFADFSRDLDTESAGGQTVEEQFADFSRDLDSKSPVGRTEEEPFADSSRNVDSEFAWGRTVGDPFADFSRDFSVTAAENLDLEQTVDIPNQLEDEDSEDFNELEAEANDLFSQTEREVIDLPNEVKMQALGKSEVRFLETGNTEVDEAEDAETSSELDEQTAESEFEFQTETSNVLEVQTATTLSELKDTADNRLKFEVEISEAVREASVDDDVTTEEASILEVVKVPKQKKKIRVSFSEDFDDEIGDFNISSSSRSSLKSPPPLPSSEDSESPSPSPENIDAVATEEEDYVSPLSPASSQWTPQEQDQRKEVYHTSAGRISIGVGEEEASSSMALNSEFSPSVASFTDEIIMKARAQVGEMIESAKGTISEADNQLSDSSLHASSAAVLYSSDVSQPVLSSSTLHSAHDAAIMSEDESNNAFTIVGSDFATFDPTNSDPSAVNSNPLNDARVKSSVDSHNLELTEPSAVTSEPLTFSQENPLPAVLAVSSYEDVPFDSLTSMPTHVRTLSGASTGSFQGGIYSEEWQDDEILQVAEQSGLEAEHDDPTRKKIVPSSDFVEAAVADNDAEEVEDNEAKKEDDEESDAGDLEWERRRLLQEGDDTPVKIPTRPGIQPTLTEEETSPEGQRWKRVSVSGSDFDIDLQVVEPFKNVLSHGGYYDEGLSAIIVFYGCNLPSRSREDYAYIMNHLFHYVIHTLEELVADDYVIIYFHGSTPRRQMPNLAWLKRCYQSIDRRLKKNLKGLFLVHPTLWLRTIVMMTKPFISTKFSSKLRFVRTLEELNALVPLTNVTIPDAIVQFGRRRSIFSRPKTM